MTYQTNQFIKTMFVTIEKKIFNKFWNKATQ